MSDPWQPLTRYSEFARRCLRQWPEYCRALREQGRLESRGVTLPEAPANGGEDAFDRWLRAGRQTEALRIAWRDVTGAADLVATVTDLSRLAEYCLQAALAFQQRVFRQRFGELPNSAGRPFGFCILAVGKLGGEELNFSSDIDLMFVHDGTGQSSGPGRLPADEYVRKLAQSLITRLHRVLPEGRVYRVDTRLRPFGDSGALVWARRAMVQYYVQQGRNWERYVLQKARPVAGDRDLGRALLDELQPFIYRRYLDYGLFEGIRGMRAEILRQAERRGHRDHLKTGRGGIREIEFLVQSLQMLRGGQDPKLRRNNLLDGLQALQARGFMAAGNAAVLRAAYLELRRLENRLQMRDDRQQHQLPMATEARQQFAEFCGYPNWQALYGQLEQHRQRVHGQFRDMFGDETGAAGQPLTASEPAALAEAATLQRRLQLEPEAAGQTASAIRPLLQLIERYLPDATAHRRWRRLAAELLQDAAGSPRPDTALVNALHIVAAIAGRSNYLALLLEIPAARQRMLKVCAEGGYLVERLAASPLLLDELIDDRLMENLAADAGDLEARLQDIIIRDEDPEQLLLRLQHWQQAYRFRIAGNELLGRLDARAARRQLSWLAEAIIRVSLEICRRQLGADVDLAVIAYGSLGALEMHYESDLDLVFLYADREREREYQTTRLAQRLIHWLTTLASRERLYRIDTRLRPNGQSGTLVSSLAAFCRYQRQQAWLWEWQALSRARCISGPRAIAETFRELRHEIIAAAQDPDDLQRAMQNMYRRLCREQRLERRPQQLAVLRVQFLTQYHLLRMPLPAMDIPTELNAQLELIAGTDPSLAKQCRELQDLWLGLLKARNTAQLRSREMRMPSRVGEAVARHWQAVFNKETRGSPAGLVEEYSLDRPAPGDDPGAPGEE